MGIGEIDSQSPYGALVGTRIVRVDEGGIAIEVDYDAHEGFTNRIGTLAGALLAGLLDSVTGLVANAVLPDGRVAVHKHLHVDYLRPGTPGPVKGLGRILEHDDREIRSFGELLDAEGRRIASAEATLRVLEWPRPDPPAGTPGPALVP